MTTSAGQPRRDPGRMAVSPFDGINRIRFKGSHFSDSQPRLERGLPRKLLCAQFTTSFVRSATRS